MRHAFLILMALLAASPTALSAQQRIDRPGPVEHRAAAAVFPEHVGEFRRANVYSYDSAGTNLSATYQLGGTGALIILSVYIYPVAQAEAAYASGGDHARLCGSDFEGARAAIGQRNPAARLTDDGAAPAVADVPAALSRRSVYSFVTQFDDEEQEVRSEVDLYCYVAGAWQVKYRVTSRPQLDADGALRRFISEGPWPGRGAPANPKDIAAASDPAAPPA